MTNEQKVRIDRLERYLISDKMNIYTEVRVNDLDTGLSLIKEQQEEIEKYKNMIEEHKKQLKKSGIYGYDYDLKID